MFQVSVGIYSLKVGYGVPPAAFGVANRYAKVVDEAGLAAPDGTLCWVAVGRSGEASPLLVVTQKYAPSLDAGLLPGILVVPETARLFIGAGERLLAYDLRTPKRLWEDVADTGFWSWARHDDVIVMSAELWASSACGAVSLGPRRRAKVVTTRCVFDLVDMCAEFREDERRKRPREEPARDRGHVPEFFNDMVHRVAYLAHSAAETIDARAALSFVGSDIGSARSSSTAASSTLSAFNVVLAFLTRT